MALQTVCHYTCPYGQPPYDRTVGVTLAETGPGYQSSCTTSGDATCWVTCPYTWGTNCYLSTTDTTSWNDVSCASGGGANCVYRCAKNSTDLVPPWEAHVVSCNNQIVVMPNPIETPQPYTPVSQLVTCNSSMNGASACAAVCPAGARPSKLYAHDCPLNTTGTAYENAGIYIAPTPSPSPSPTASGAPSITPTLTPTPTSFGNGTTSISPSGCTQGPQQSNCV